jgi:hypothetical protein
MNMNTWQTIVRLDKEPGIAELEVLTPHDKPRPEGLRQALARIGIRAFCTVEMITPRYQITRAKLVTRDGIELDTGHVMRILCAVDELQHAYGWQRARLSA